MFMIGLMVGTTTLTTASMKEVGVGVLPYRAYNTKPMTTTAKEMKVAPIHMVT